jgi:hypothetical protein
MSREWIATALMPLSQIDATSKYYSPRIEVQLKATMQRLVNTDDKLSFKLTIKNYDDLRADTIYIPYLIG